MNRRRGLTLIELLVAMAILSVLAGLLLPALASSLCGSRFVVCHSNEKQIYQWGLTYADDWRGVLPHKGTTYQNVVWAWWQLSATNWPCKYRPFQTPYPTQGEIFYCPQARQITPR